jgi:alkylated DNA repair dioxygenase AlkB
MDSLPWRQDSIQVYGKQYAQPRLTCLLGDAGTRYTYSGIQMESVPFTPALDQLRRRINLEFGWDLNLCLANLYRDGNDSNGWHSDDEKELGPDPAIASVSLGSERYFQLRSKKNRSDTYKILLEGGSLLLMYPPMQRFWQHQIPKTRRTMGPRINLTFRRFFPA